MAEPLLRPRRAVAADAARMAYVAESAYSPYFERMGGLRPGPLDADYTAAVADSEAWVVDHVGEVVGFRPPVLREMPVRPALVPSRKRQGLSKIVPTRA